MAWAIPLIAPIVGALAGWGLNKLDQSGAPGAGTPEQYGKIRTGTKEASKFQKQIFKTGGGLPQNPLYQQGSNFLSQLLSNNPEAFQNFEAPYMENFQQNILPMIAERFAGMGTGGGALNSSALQQTLAQAGRGLQKDLAAMRSGLQAQSLPQLLQYAQQPIQNQLAAMQWSPYQTTHTQRQPGLYDELAGLVPGTVESIINTYANNKGNTLKAGGISSGGNAPNTGGGISTGGNFNPYLY